MRGVEIVPSIPAHVEMIRGRLRARDARECLAVGVAPGRAIWRSYRSNLFAMTSFVDGEIASMSGLGGSFLSDEGAPWLFTTPAIERIPFTFIREARSQLARMLTVKPRLSNHVDASYDQAIGFLTQLGFNIDEPQAYGPRGALFRHFWMERE